MKKVLACSMLALSLSLAAQAAPPEDPCAEAPPEGATREAVPAGVVQRADTRLGTRLQLGVSGVSCEVANQAFTDVFALFSRLEQLTDAESEQSALRRIHEAAGKEPVQVEPELLALLEVALEYSRHTEGAFDPTFAALEGLWTFRPGEELVPSDEDVERRRALVSWQKVKLDKEKSTIFLEQEGMKLGLGGIAKGYGVDQAVELLKERGVSDFIIKTGGEIFVAGNPGGGDRRVGVPDPRGEKNYALLDVRDRALNTSSDNEKFFILDAERFHHIIDPKTGRPARGARSVSVISEDATSADALSTAIFVMGPRRGMALVEKLPGVEAVLVDSKNQVHVSSGLSERLLLGAPTDRSP